MRVGLNREGERRNTPTANPAIAQEATVVTSAPVDGFRLDGARSLVAVAAAVTFGFLFALFLQALAFTILAAVDADQSGFTFTVGDNRVDYGQLLATGIALAGAAIVLWFALRRRAQR